MSDPIDYRLVLEAVSLAARAHQGQLRKDRQTPYAAHPFRVCLIVRDRFGCDDPRMLLAALLHDTIEDTTTDFDDLAERYGPEVASWVAVLTKDKRLPEDEREADYIRRLQEGPWQVHVCKLADLYDNMTDSVSLPPEKRAHSLKRYEQFFEALRSVASPGTERPLALVEELLGEVRKDARKKAGK